jgi:uncharacterized membrane protein
MTAPRPSPFPPFLGFAPYAVLLLAGVFLVAHWDAIPARFPVQWGLDGLPSRYVHKSGFGVFLPIAIGLAVCAFLRATASAAQSASRPPPEGHGPTLRVMLATELLIAVVFALAALATALRWPRAAPVIASVTVAGVLGLLAFAFVTARASSALRRSHGDAAPSGAWKGGVVYFNPKDPAILVPKRFGMGYTLNFAHARAYWFLVALLLFVAGIVFVSLLASRG